MNNSHWDKFIDNTKMLFKHLWILLKTVINLLITLGYIFIISPFFPLVDIGKKYFQLIIIEFKGLDFSELNKSIKSELISYTLAFMFLIFATVYTVLGTPYSFYIKYIDNIEKNDFYQSIESSYINENITFYESNTKEIIDWFALYNQKRKERNCDFMKRVSVDILEWEKNGFNFNDKYNEQEVIDSSYTCYNYDNINEKSYLNFIDMINIDLIKQGKDQIIVATGYMTHSKIEDNLYIGLSKRKFTLWKKSDWDLWRIHEFKNITD